MLSVAEAWRRVTEAVFDFGTERVPVPASAGRILRQGVSAERDQPPFDRVMMDGMAVRYEPGRRSYRRRAVLQAGEPAVALDDPAGCIEAMTGAVLPPGTDTVVPVERYHREGDDCVLEDGYDPEPRQFVHPRGSDHPAGTELLRAGAVVGAAEVAVLASQGLSRVSVGVQPPIAVVSTGDELVGPDRPIADHEIRLSNGPAVLAALLQHGFAGSRHYHLRDDEAAMRRELGELLESNPVLILSGGVSRGKADYVPGVLRELGVEPIFHRVAQRPGKPMWFGARRDRNLVFALPGNPVSTLVCFRRYALPALLQAAGLSTIPSETARLDADYEFRPELTCFLPVRISVDADAVMNASPVITNTSGDFAALAGSAGFVELPSEPSRFPAGTKAALHRWRML